MTDSHEEKISERQEAESESHICASSLTDDEWDHPQPDALNSSEIFVVDLSGFEGPLDLLLDLAQRQKVDLANISVAVLADQYLGYIEATQLRDMDIAGDYLVMAAWLTYLKSRLLVPEEEMGDEDDPEVLAEALRKRLLHLNALRKLAKGLDNQPRLGEHFFKRGLPEISKVSLHIEWEAKLYDLLKAYAYHRERTSVQSVNIAKRDVWPVDRARDVLWKNVQTSDEWISLNDRLKLYLDDPEAQRTALASSFAASLDMTKEKLIDLFQEKAFEPLYARRHIEDDLTHESGQISVAMNDKKRA